MKSKRARLDRFISARLGINRRDVRPMLARGEIKLDGQIATSAQQFVDEFTHVRLNDAVLQSQTAKYFMLNKPVGVVSATKDLKHTTVIDLLNKTDALDLHIVGRLDFNTSGLVLLTNNGRWSRRLMEPDNKVAKHYRVTLQNPMTDDYMASFEQGMFFAYEGITTRPAALTILSEHVAQVSLVEGRYHQIKRMFGRFRNPVVALHRYAVGDLALDERLAPGEYRALTQHELSLLSE